MGQSSGNTSQYIPVLVKLYQSVECINAVCVKWTHTRVGGIAVDATSVVVAVTQEAAGCVLTSPVRSAWQQRTLVDIFLTQRSLVTYQYNTKHLERFYKAVIL